MTRSTSPFQQIRPRATNKALVVEDNATQRFSFAGVLHDLGYTCVETGEVAVAANMLRTQDFDVVLLDLKVKDGTTLSLADYLGVTDRSATVILITGTGAFPNGEATAISPRIDYVLRKPVNLSDLSALLVYARRERRA